MEDRRIRKTKKAFYNALIELLRKNEIRNIGIQELCDLADSHRSTFYYHYSDIYELYEEMESRILNDFSSLWITDESHTYYSVYEGIITYLNENWTVWSVLMSGNASPHFKEKVCKILENKYIEIWQYEEDKSTFSNEFYIIAKACISAFITLFTEWLNSDSTNETDRFKAILGDMDIAFDTLLEKYL